jgi:hypothetical protein
VTCHNEMTRIGLALALASVMAGCGTGDTPPAVGVAGSALSEANGLSPNGLSRNGLSRNGLSRNGLSRNGLSRNGLLSAEFQSWFAVDPATSAAVMTYVVRCAAPAGQSYSFTSPTTGVTYTWSGSLGLAPGWASGLEATVAEEQVITACLAAHVNKYGRQVVISVLGQGATGVPIPTGKNELPTYSQREGCFFGNFFEDEGVFVGLDHQIWDHSYSSARACAFDIFGVGPSADCPPVNNVGPCWLLCKADPTGTYYTSCGVWVNGAWKSYLPITTRILPADVYRCGDGTCQFTEQCGTGTTADSCQADCGVCPTIKASATTTTSKTTKTSENSQ